MLVEEVLEFLFCYQIMQVFDLRWGKNISNQEMFYKGYWTKNYKMIRILSKISTIVDIINSSSIDDSSDSSLCLNEFQPEQKDEPLLVKVKGKIIILSGDYFIKRCKISFVYVIVDTCTWETMNQKMIASQVWNFG